MAKGDKGPVFVGEVLSRAVGPLAVAFFVSLASGPMVKRLAVQFNFYDRPDGGLKPHDRPTPYLGGLAIYLGWLSAWAVTVVLLFSRNSAVAGIAGSGSHHFLWIAVGGTVLMVTGLIDDRIHLSPLLRMAVQAAASGILVLGGVGKGVSSVLLEGWVDPTIAAPTVVAMPLLSVVICAFLIVGATNSTNLIDGMDGLCAGVVAISAMGFIALTAALASTHSISMIGAVLIVTISVALIGACAGFLFYNFNPASMFMGDSGSLLLGFSVATILILFAEHAGWRGLLGAAVVYGFPLFDTALAVGRRWVNKRKLFKGDRSHFYDQIRDRGFSVRQTVILCYAMGVGFLVLGTVLTFLPTFGMAVAVVIMPFVGLLVCRRMGLLRVERESDELSSPERE